MVSMADRSKVLVVDDDELTRKLFSDSLGKHYEVLTAGSAEEGMRLYVENNPVVVLLDVVLPGRDGLQSLKFIRSISPETCVIMITGCPKAEYFRSAFDHGASYFLEKPIGLDDLRKTVRQGIEDATQEMRRNQMFNEMAVMVNELNSKVRECEALKEDLAEARQAARELEQGLSGVEEDLALPAEPGQLAPAQLSVDLCRWRIRLRALLRGGGKDPSATIRLGAFVEAQAKAMSAYAQSCGVHFDARFRVGEGLRKTPREGLETSLKTVMGQAIRAASKTTRSLRILGLEHNGDVEFRMEYRPPDAGASSGGDPRSSDPLERLELGLAASCIQRLGGAVRVQQSPGAVAIVSCRIPLDPA